MYPDDAPNRKPGGLDQCLGNLQEARIKADQCRVMLRQMTDKVFGTEPQPVPGNVVGSTPTNPGNAREMDESIAILHSNLNRIDDLIHRLNQFIGANF